MGDGTQETHLCFTHVVVQQFYTSDVRLSNPTLQSHVLNRPFSVDWGAKYWWGDAPMCTIKMPKPFKERPWTCRLYLCT